MMDQTEMDNRRIDYVTRIGRVDRVAWMREASSPAGGGRRQRIANLVSLSRRVWGVIRRAERNVPAPEGAVAPAR